MNKNGFTPNHSKGVKDIGIIKPKFESMAKRKIYCLRNRDTGFTLVELLIVSALFFVLGSAVTYAYVFVLQTVNKEYAVQERQNAVYECMRFISTDLKEAESVSRYYYSTTGTYLGNTLQFRKLGADNKQHAYCYYFRNSADSWPNPPFSAAQMLYELRRADLTAGDDPGSVSADRWGALLCKDILSPVFVNGLIRSTTSFTLNQDGTISVDLMAVETGDTLTAPTALTLNYDRIVRVMSAVKPKN